MMRALAIERCHKATQSQPDAPNRKLRGPGVANNNERKKRHLGWLMLICLVLLICLAFLIWPSCQELPEPVGIVEVWGY